MTCLPVDPGVLVFAVVSIVLLALIVAFVVGFEKGAAFGRSQ